MAFAQGYASLRITKAGMSAAAVTAGLGIEPTYSHEMGDAFGPWGVQRRRQAMWTLSTKAGGLGRLDDHLIRLLDLIEPKRSAIEVLANQNHAMDLFCFVNIVGGQGGIVLNADLLPRLAALPIDLSFDVYG